VTVTNNLDAARAWFRKSSAEYRAIRNAEARIETLERRVRVLETHLSLADRLLDQYQSQSKQGREHD
jgi:hypothetical protein